MEQYMARLANPDLIFGLVVRFFGVFIVLIIVMIGIWIVGQIFIRNEKSEAKEKTVQAVSKKQRQAAPDVERTTQPGAGPEATEEVAAVIAVHLQESAEAARLREAASSVSEEVAAVIALSLTAYSAQQMFLHPGLMEKVASASDQESPWKIMGRQEAFSTRTLPFTGRGAAKGR